MSDDLISKPPTGLLEIGKFYLVPCLRASEKPPIYALKGEWVPVLLPEHEDAEIIGIPDRHFHLDFRFLSNRQNERASIAYAVERQSKTGYGFDSGITYKRKKMMRESPAPNLYFVASWFKTLQARYKDSCLVNMRCPHRGIDLSGCRPISGVITCPAHGL